MKSTFLNIVLFFFCMSFSQYGFAESLNIKNADNKQLTLADIQKKIQAIKDKQTLSDELRNRILSAYYDSEEHLQELAKQDAQAEALKQAPQQLQIESKQLDLKIADIEKRLKNRVSEKLAIFPIDELELRLAMEKNRLSDLDAQISRLDTQISEQQKRPQWIRAKMSELKNTYAGIQQKTKLIQTAGLENAEEEAKIVELDSLTRLINASLQALELELNSHTLRSQVQKKQARLLDLQRELQELLVGDLDNYLIEKRQQKIAQEREELAQAEKAAEGKHPLIRDVAQENRLFNRALQDINLAMEDYLAQKTDIDNLYKQIASDFQTAEKKIDLAGISPGLGNLLREQYRSLPKRKHYKNLENGLQKEIAIASLEQFKLDDAKKLLSDINQALSIRMSIDAVVDLNPDEKLKIRTELRLLLNDQKDLVNQLSTTYTEFSRVLGDLDFSLHQLLNESEKFRQYLNQRLLWVPNAPIMDLQYGKTMLSSLLWFLNPQHWWQAVLDGFSGIQKTPILLALLLVVALCYWQLKRYVAAFFSQQPQPNAPFGFTFSYFLYGLAYILLLILPVPLFCLALGGIWLSNDEAGQFSHALGNAFIAAAVPLAIIQFFYRLLKRETLPQNVFHWSLRTQEILAQQLQWIRFIAVPGVFIVTLTDNDTFLIHSHTLGRSALILMLLALSYLFFRLAHPEKGLLNVFYLSHPESGFTYFRYVLLVGVMLIPLVIAGFAVAGYYQSALELQQKLILTLRLVFLLALLHALMFRWMALSNEQLLQHNAIQHHAPPVDSPASVIENRPHESELLPNEDEIDISKINTQSHKLVNTAFFVLLISGSWLVWKDIFPALSVFDQFVLWQYSEVVDGKDSLQAVTLSHLLLCLIYIGLTWVFVDNFPSLVDLLSVGRLSITAGSRYALIHLMRYGIVAVTFLVIVNELGGSWAKVQWLVAALSVGLGFGLQEIFANLVSGIILLFERPIRVGDWITIGNVSGSVSRIQMRATHIIDADKKELIVPNKVFITDQLINWTLTDAVTRVVIPIGIAYGSDVELAKQVMLDAMKSIPKIRKEPAPSVFFVGFGESSLDFRLWLYVSELRDRFRVSDELYLHLYQTLQQHNIVIPRPQRDVHLHTANNPSHN